MFYRGLTYKLAHHQLGTQLIYCCNYLFFYIHRTLCMYSFMLDGHPCLKQKPFWHCHHIISPACPLCTVMYQYVYRIYQAILKHMLCVLGILQMAHVAVCGT